MTRTLGADPRIGTELAGYRIETLLGRGGMSVVYRAEHLRLKRKVALKLLAPELAEDERFRERFLRESELAASLDHPNVVPIYDASETDGLLYIAMRYVEGTDLRALLRHEGALVPARTLILLDQVAEALDTAHGRGLVHRDVKPGNVLIGARDHAYLSDFGLSKQTSSESGLTQTGQFVGTADYVAPEQIERRPVDARTDVYALGCVLYECLTGEPPFAGDSLMAVLWGHLNGVPPSASARNLDLPAGIDAVIARALAKSPEDRYGSCRELVTAARAALAAEGPTTSVAPVLPAPSPAARRMGVIGREMELSALAEFLEAIPAGPTALLLEGEAGIGKTALWREGLAAAHERSYRVLACQTVESETTLPFAALGDLLEDVPAEALSLLPEPQRRAVDIALLRLEPEGQPLPQRAVSLALVGALRLLAASGPLIVAVDDLQWLDSPSVGALEFVIRRLEAEPIGILASRRSGERDVDSSRLERALPGDRLQRLLIAPLEPDLLGRLISERLDAHLLRPTLVELHRLSGGNPFFALEIARTLQRRGLPLRPGEAFPVPESLRELVRDRLAQLPAGAREAACAVSALAHPTVSLVVAALGQGPGLEEAEEAGVLEIEAERIRFSHPLFASVFYAETAPARRRVLHRRLAEVLTDPEERARHLALATTGPDYEVAAALDEAARRANARGAPGAAAELCEQARRLTPSERADEQRRRGIEAAEYHFLAGATSRARSLLEEVVAASAHGSARAEALARLARVRWHADSCEAAAALYEEALSEVGDDLALRAAIEEGLGMSSYMRGDLPDAVAHASTVVALAEELGDEAALAQARALVGLWEFFQGRGVPLAVMEHAIELERDAETKLRIFGQPSFMLALMLRATGDLDGARALCRALYELDVERGDEHYLPLLLANLSILELFAGNWGRAARYAEESYESALQTGQKPGQAFAAAARAQVDACLGRADAARADAEEGLALGAEVGWRTPVTLSRSALGFLELSLGSPAEAHRHLGPLADRLVATGIGEPAWFRFLPDEIEVLIALGQLKRARSLLEPFAERGRTLDRAWALANAGRCRGLLLSAEGDLQGALRALEQALRQHERVPEPFELGRTMLAQGTILRRNGKEEAARDSLEQALAIFDRLGAPLWSEKARLELRQS